MPSPESCLSAAKKVAEAAGVNWSSEGSKVYRELQAADWLPKSSGRRVYAAHPNLIAVFVIGLAASSAALTVTEAVEAFALARKEGSNESNWTNLDELRGAIAFYLTDPSAADEVDLIEFYAERKEAVVTFKSGNTNRFFTEKGGSNHPQHQRLIYSRGVISADLFRSVRELIRWNLRGHPMTDADVIDEERNTLGQEDE